MSTYSSVYSSIPPSVASLAQELQQKVTLQIKGEQYWVALVGAPGSGKSTVSQQLKAALGDQLAVIPMDGFHYYRHELDNMPNPKEAHERRGAPFTFNAKKFVQILNKAKQSGQGSFPSFDHGQGDPIENTIHLQAHTPIVLVEGNYMLLDEQPWCSLRKTVFNETWFLSLANATRNNRLAKRHEQHGLSPEQAMHRTHNSDGSNAELVIKSAKNADRIICLE